MIALSKLVIVVVGGSFLAGCFLTYFLFRPILIKLRDANRVLVTKINELQPGFASRVELEKSTHKEPPA